MDKYHSWNPRRANGVNELKDTVVTVYRIYNEQEILTLRDQRRRRPPLLLLLYPATIKSGVKRIVIRRLVTLHEAVKSALK
jgi:hypothetical protein